MRVKTIIKNKVEDNNKFLIGGLNWKEKKNQQNDNKSKDWWSNKKNKNHKPGLNNEIKNHQNFDKMPRKKLKIKNIICDKLELEY